MMSRHGVSMFRDRARAAALTACLMFVAAPGVAALDVEIVRLDGRTVRGRLAALAPQIVLETPEGSAAFEPADVLAIRPLTPPDTPQPASAEGPLRFELADGSSFRGRVERASDHGLVILLRPPGTPADDPLSRQIELSMLRAVIATDAPAESAARIEQALRERDPAATRDGTSLADVAVVARAGESLVLRGTVQQLGPEGVRFVWSSRDVVLPWTRLGGVVFGRPSPRQPTCLVTLRDGVVFGGRIRGGDDASLVLQSAILGEITLPWSSVERIECSSDRLVFLSDVEPSAYEFEPFFTQRWNYVNDRTFSARPIRLGGRAYAKGVSVHSRAVLDYDINAAFQQFAAVAGILDEMGTRGCVTMRVRGDGRVLWEESGIRGGQPPREIAVGIVGVRRLTLEVDYDQDLDLSDQACWGFARLIR